MNNLDKQYTNLLQDILDNGVTKQDRTGTGTLSTFGRQIRHKMSEGFPLLTTKKMPFKTIATELLWFLRGDTNIKYLVDNDCHIWDGDAYKNYWFNWRPMLEDCGEDLTPYTQEEFINKIKNDDEFAERWGELGPVYGKQWRKWKGSNGMIGEKDEDGVRVINWEKIDQIVNLINDLKTNPDSRRLMVTAWNPSDLDSMVLLPCHYGFQVYTRELDETERVPLMDRKLGVTENLPAYYTEDEMIKHNIPTRAISLMWNQRSVDTFLGLPFNIASYGLLLEIIAKAVNMVPDELIGNLGDTHLYLNHIEQAKEQIGRKLTAIDRAQLAGGGCDKLHQLILDGNYSTINADNEIHKLCDTLGVPTRTREPFPLPTLNINTEFWPTESGECGVGAIDAISVFNNFTNDHFCRCLLEEDLQLANYQSHPTIKAPLSN
jgi:thymidylate synthase